MDYFPDSMKKAEISMRLTEFEVPPMQDVLIVGRRAPIGPEAVRRIVEILSPDQYEVCEIEHPIIEAIAVRKTLIKMINREKLFGMIIEEVGKIADETVVIRVQLNIVLHVSKSIDL